MTNPAHSAGFSAFRLRVVGYSGRGVLQANSQSCPPYLILTVVLLASHLGSE